MKVNLFKGLLAVMLIGLFASCSQKNKDLKNDNESKQMVVNKVKKDFVPEGKKFYLVDVSGSMQGKGSVKTSDIFASVIEDMSFAFSKITDSCEVVIIPFSSTPLSPISFNSSDKEKMQSALQNLEISNGNTNIYSAFQMAVEKFDSTKNNVVFFITDGLHNEFVSKDVLYETLNSFSEKAESNYSHLYYYLKTPAYKEFDFYKVFENNDNMDVVESLVFTKEVNDTTFVTNPIVADSKGGFNFPMWLLWVLLAIVAIIILYFIITKANPLALIPKLGAQGDTGSIWMPKDLDCIPSDKNYNNPDHLTKRQILEKYGFEKGVPFKDNGYGEEPVLDRAVPTINGKKAEIDGDYNNLPEDAKKNLMKEKVNRDKAHLHWFEQMAKKLGMTREELMKWKEKNNYVLHETRDGRVQLVPRSLHALIGHDGGISLFRANGGNAWVK